MSFIVRIIADIFVSVKSGRGIMTFAEHLLQLRKQRGLKQTELAKIIDAQGVNKAAAVLGAIHTGCVDTVIIDKNIAKQISKQYNL